MNNIALMIDYMFLGDVQEYFIKDEVCGCRLVEGFTSREEAQAYLDMHREGILRRGPPLLNTEDAEMYSGAIELFEHRLRDGAIEAKEAHSIVMHLAKIENRCPDEAFRLRLVSVLERLRALQR
jgi:hypothetical protein